MNAPKTVALTLAALAGGAAIGAAAMVWGGVYDVASNVQHTQPVYSLLETAMRQSVRWRARGIEAPPLGDPRQLAQGAACYRARCVRCHGAPGVAQDDIGKSMQPLPGPLVDARQRWSARELYWLTRNGIKMSGMPAWEYRLSDQELWAVVAFVERLPDMTPQAYAQATAFEPVPGTPRTGATGTAIGCNALAAQPATRPGDALRGRTALTQYACNACHAIPDVTSSHPNVGTPLAGIGRRGLIAGRLANTPENMVRWLRHTREVDPLTAMPEMGVTEQDARDIAAYLGTLE